MPRNIIAVVLFLMLLTGIAIGQMRTFVTSPRVPAATLESRAATTALEFYAAVNRYLDAGDPSSINAMLSPDFVSHSTEDGADGSATDLLDYLRLFRETFPDARLDSRLLSAHGALAVFEVRMQSVQTAEISGVSVPRFSAESGYEILRIEDGRIGEWWVNRIMPSPFQLAYPIPGDTSAGTPMEPRVEVVSFDSGAIYELIDQNGMIVVMQEGQIRFRVAGREAPRPVHEAGSAVPESARVTDSETVELTPGAAALVPSGAQVRLRNDDRAGATLLLISVRESQFDARLANDYVVIESTGIRRWLLAGGGTLSTMTDQVNVQIGRTILPPGNSVPFHQVGSAEVVLMESGEVEVVLSAGAAVWTQPGKTFVAVEERQIIAPGTGLTANPGSIVEYRASGDDPAVFWLIAFIPIHPR